MMEAKRPRQRKLSTSNEPRSPQYIEAKSVGSFLDELDQLTNPKPGLFYADCPLHVNKFSGLIIKTMPGKSARIECVVGCDLEEIVSVLDLYPAIVSSSET